MSELRNKLDQLRAACSNFLAAADAVTLALEARGELDAIEKPAPASPLLALYRAACANTGWHSEVLYAIWHHETGHGKSAAWLEANNPGGLKYHPEFEYLGHKFGSWTAKGGTVYARFPSREEAVSAHVRWFSNKRYAPARGLEPMAQARKIGELGYVQADMLTDWSANVTVYLGKIMKGTLA